MATTVRIVNDQRATGKQRALRSGEWLRNRWRRRRHCVHGVRRAVWATAFLPVEMGPAPRGKVAGPGGWGGSVGGVPHDGERPGRDEREDAEAVPEAFAHQPARFIALAAMSAAALCPV